MATTEREDVWLTSEPDLDDLISDLERASNERPPAIFDGWLYKKAAEALRAAKVNAERALLKDMLRCESENAPDDITPLEFIKWFARDLGYSDIETEG